MGLNKVNFRTFKAIVTDFQKEPESNDYDACTYMLGESKVIYRKAHITPTKLGQFVTLWKRKRKRNGMIRPYDINDDFDLVIIYCVKNKKRGLFIFNKEVLNVYGIISGNKKPGKRALRIYPPWDKVTSPQPIQTQKWQLEYFTILS
jgi:hypothetical protein